MQLGGRQPFRLGRVRAHRLGGGARGPAGGQQLLRAQGAHTQGAPGPQPEKVVRQGKRAARCSTAQRSSCTQWPDLARPPSRCLLLLLLLQFPGGWVAGALPETYILELDDPEYLQEALCDVPEVGITMPLGEGYFVFTTLSVGLCGCVRSL